MEVSVDADPPTLIGSGSVLFYSQRQRKTYFSLYCLRQPTWKSRQLLQGLRVGEALVRTFRVLFSEQRLLSELAW